MSLKCEPNVRRDCYSERICDDLSEVVLNYLSLEDRLRLECVSKKFRRTIFSRMREMVFEEFENMNLLSLERIVTRFANIETKVFGHWNATNNESEGQALRTLMKNTNNLTAFKCGGYNGPDCETEKILIDKFAHKLTALSLWNLKSETDWTRVPNVEDLTIGYFPSELSSIHFKNLKRFCIFDLSDKDCEQAMKFLERHRKTITHLRLFCRDIVQESNYQRIMSLLAKLEHLVHITTGLCGFRINEKRFEKQLQQMTQNCKQLKSLYIGYGWDPENDRKEPIDLSSLKLFPHLNRLDLELYSSSYLTPETFKGFRQLTHLRVFTGERHKLDDSLLANCDKDFPNLRSLNLKIRGKNKAFKATEMTADLLSRLSILESIRLQIKSESIRALIRDKLKQNCKHISKINFELNEY